MASIVGKALRGFGRALKRGKNLRSSGTGTIKFKPGVGGLKESRKTFEGLQKSTAEGVRKFGRPHTTKVLSEQKGTKSLPSIVRQSGDLERRRKKLNIPKGKK
jgi:hypothetical protein